MGKIEKELKHHESMKASKAHKGLKSGGQASGEMIDADETKTTIKGNLKPYEKTKMDTSKKDKASGTGSVKEGNGGGYKKGGSINSETSSGDYATTKMYQAKPDNSPATTGGVKNGNAGGYKRGGAMKKMATGGVVKGQAGYATGGMIPSESTSGSPATTIVDTGKYDNAPANTGGVSNGNAGGFKRGGATKKHFATGGSVNSAGSAVAMPQGRKPIPSPVQVTQLAGTYKKGGKVAPGNRQLQAVNKMENATAMRQAKMDSNLKYGPANKLKLAEGGSPSDMEKISKYVNVYGNDENSKSMMDKVKSARYVPKEDPKDISDKASRELEEALNPLSMMQELYNKARNAFTGQGSMTDKERADGSVTKTKESVTVSPGKKRGGRVC
jgi:hypothetical protein